MEELNHLLDEAARLQKQDNQRPLQALLQQLIPSRIGNYHKSVSTGRIPEYTDLLFKTLWLELDEEEEESVELAELALLGISGFIEKITGDEPENLSETQSEALYLAVRKRILLLRYFADFLTDSLIEVFLKKFRENNLLEARSLALDRLAHMQLADMYFLEQRYGSRVNEDDGINEACNTVPLAALPTEEELADATLMMRVLAAYLRVKYASGKVSSGDSAP